MTAANRQGDAPDSSRDGADQSLTETLTPRQRQILNLIQDGRANKEIAHELGIGMGTVKQHVVALFKKLQVSNRAMAVARLAAVHGASPPSLPRFDDPGEARLENRPCLVLSVALQDGGDDPAAVRGLHGLLAGLAYDHDAVFVARRGAAGDLLFGVQRIHEDMLGRALRVMVAVATAVQRDGLGGQSPAALGALVGGVDTGLAMASMYRTGGWSGEAIASATISAARGLAAQAGAGTVLLSAATARLLTGVVCGAGAGMALPIADLPEILCQMVTQPMAQPAPLLGREGEWALLCAALDRLAAGSPGVVRIEGEAGIGKTHLCATVLEAARQRGLSAAMWRCADTGADRLIGGTPPREQAFPAFLEEDVPPGGTAPQVLVLDEMHRLTAAGRQALAHWLPEAGRHHLVVVAGRRLRDWPPMLAEAPALFLRRLTDEAGRGLVRHLATLNGMADLAPALQRQVSERAQGVPLFARELVAAAREHQGEGGALGPHEVPPSLLMVVVSRLDSLHLDQTVLRVLARQPRAVTPADLAVVAGLPVAMVGAAAAQAVAAGVLRQDPGGALRFAHPLVRDAILSLGVPPA